MAQRLHREVMRVAADARDSDSFAFQLFGPLDVWLGNNAMGQHALDSADEDRVFVSLHEGPGNASRADLGHLAVARKNSGDCRRTWSDEDRRDLQIVFLEESGF